MLWRITFARPVHPSLMVVSFKTLSVLINEERQYKNDILLIVENDCPCRRVQCEHCDMSGEYESYAAKYVH